MDIKKNIAAIAVLMAFSVSLMYDRQISLFFQMHRSIPLDIMFIAFTYMGSMIAVLFIITSLFLWRKHMQKWIIPFWASLLFAEAVTYLLKAVVARPRPEIIGIAAVIAATGYSFPSAHATASFSALPVLGKVYRKWMAVWILIAVIIAASRVYLGVHYMSDVIAGAAIGYCSGLLCVRLAGAGWFKKLNIFGR